MTIKDSKAFYSKAIVDKLDVLEKTVIIQWNIRRKRISYCLQLN